MKKMLSSDLIKQITAVQKAQRKKSRSNNLNTIQVRLAALDSLKALLVENETRWLEAMKKNLNKPRLEAYSSEIAILLNEIDYNRKNLKKWLKPKSKRRLLLTGLEKIKVTYQPFGSILVISPWNYPLQLALMPAIGALAAGNGIVLKPSEFTPNVSRLLAELVPKYFKPDTLFVVQGDADVAEKLTALPWDFLVFTGSSKTGRKVYESAAKNLTPTLLELGGKNPCVLTTDAVNKENVRNVIWGKFLNAGQSCIAPDTVYVPQQKYADFLEIAKEVIIEFYGEEPEKSESYGRLIHEDHFKKVSSFLGEGTIYHGGRINEQDYYIEPTILIAIDSNQSVLQEEIFGPILPVVPYQSTDQLVSHLKELPTPLVTYLFSEDSSWLKRMEMALESGSVSVNEVIVHAVSPNLPFGGKGQSGLGRYHGKNSFNSFTYEKPVYSRLNPSSFSPQYPPYTEKSLTILRKIRRKIF